MVSKKFILLSLEILLQSCFLTKAQHGDTAREECSSETLSNNVTVLQQDLHYRNKFGNNGEKYMAQIESDGNYMEDLIITEATSPSNNTVPAPKASQGLGSDIGKPQDLDPGYSDMIVERIEKAREYFHSKVMVEDLYKGVRSICRNEHNFCAFWSVLGECENNPAYMHVNCAPVCETCEVRRLGK